MSVDIRIKECNAIVICVPTPLSKFKTPDLSFIRNAMTEVTKYVTHNSIVVLESTTYPGCTDEMVVGALEEKGMLTRLQTALKIEAIAEPYIKRRAVRHLEKGRIVIFGAGTGNPYFTTDTAAVLRGVEVHADVILKGTRVDGIYDSDPEKNTNAVKFESITFDDVIKKGLNVMDSTAFTLSQENELPIVVFDMNKKGNLLKICNGENVGTVVKI